MRVHWLQHLTNSYYLRLSRRRSSWSPTRQSSCLFRAADCLGLLYPFAVSYSQYWLCRTIYIYIYSILMIRWWFSMLHRALVLGCPFRSINRAMWWICFHRLQYDLMIHGFSLFFFNEGFETARHGLTAVTRCLISGFDFFRTDLVN